MLDALSRALDRLSSADLLRNKGDPSRANGVVIRSLVIIDVAGRS
jgi:hypothetical protein